MNEHRHGVPEGANRSKWIFAAFLVIAAFFLLTEHRAHLLGILPYLLLLACPVLHVLHHGGHGARRDDRGESNSAGGHQH